MTRRRNPEALTELFNQMADEDRQRNEMLEAARVVHVAATTMYQVQEDYRRPYGCINHMPTKKLHEPVFTEKAAQRMVDALSEVHWGGERAKIIVLNPGDTYRIGIYRVEADGSLTPALI